MVISVSKVNGTLRYSLCVLLKLNLRLSLILIFLYQFEELGFGGLIFDQNFYRDVVFLNCGPKGIQNLRLVVHLGVKVLAKKADALDRL